MSSVTTLFKITIRNDYYVVDSGNDFTIVPTVGTNNLLKRYCLNFVREGRDYTITWYTKTIKNINLCFNNLFRDVVLSFTIHKNNANIYDYSNLLIQKVYQLKNNYGELLHKHQYISDDDIIEYNTYPHDLVGLLYIDLKNVNLNSQYYINVSSMSTKWRYHIVDKKNIIKNILKIFIEDDILEFVGNGVDNMVYESRCLHKLHDRYPTAVSLEYENNVGDIIKEDMPNPHICTSISSVHCYSDIVYAII